MEMMIFYGSDDLDGLCAQVIDIQFIKQTALLPDRPDPEHRTKYAPDLSSYLVVSVWYEISSISLSK